MRLSPDSPPGTVACWQRIASEPLQWLDWAEQDGCVFDPRTGHTHVLGPFPRLLLRLIDKRPRDQAELARIVARCAGLSAGPELVGQVAQTLAQLRGLSLVTDR